MNKMTYQASLKLEVMRHYNLTWEQVDLPYPQWSELRAKYLKEMNR